MTSGTTIFVNINPAAAVAAGHNYSPASSDLGDAVLIDVSTWPAEMRALLAERMDEHRRVKAAGSFKNLTVNGVTDEAVQQALADDEARDVEQTKKGIEDSKNRAAKHHADTLIVLVERRTRTRYGGKVEYEFPAWPVWDADATVIESAEAQAWIAELDAARVAAEQQYDAEVEANRIKAEAAEAEKLDERVAWIEAYGSNRLRICVTEGIEHEAIYRDERLAIERPGWEWRPHCYTDEPRNPPIEALDMLATARMSVGVDSEGAELMKAATLAYFKTYRDAEIGEAGDDDGEVVDETGYWAEARYMGRTIIFGVRITNHPAA